MSGAHVLTLAAGGGVLPLMAAAAGAASVTAIERSRMLYRMARQVPCCSAFAPLLPLPHSHGSGTSCRQCSPPHKLLQATTRKRQEQIANLS